MEGKKLVVPASGNASGGDIATWALPEGAVARLGQGLVEGNWRFLQMVNTLPLERG